jgi:hypothetical protein
MGAFAIVCIFIGAVIAPRFTLAMILFELGHPFLGTWALIWSIITFFAD